MLGKCLCGVVQFRIEGKTQNFYQCHCSLCRKANGTSSSTATFVSKNYLHWLSGEQSITKYSNETGFRSHFCSICGSPVPNIIKNTELYWVPAGLLEDSEGCEIAAHIYTHSKASWDTISSQSVQYAERPEIEVLNKQLKRK